MLSKLGPILSPLIRQPESTDTHQYIKQHERDQGRRKPFNEGRDDDNEYADETNVSVDALLLFLESMVHRYTPPTPEQGVFSSTPNIKAASPSLYAANAYAHAAKTNPHNVDDLNNTEQPAQDYSSHAPSKMAHDSNHELIEQLIEEIKLLKSKGVQELSIERGETFADSLFQAIEKAKTP